jgi:transcriptional regulator with XRE-family HTH domain
MFFELTNRNKTIKELRKNQGYTTQELAFKLKLYNIDLLKIDDLRLKELKEPLRSKLLPVLRGDVQ